MSDDPTGQSTMTCYTYDSKGRLTDVEQCDGEAALAKLDTWDDSPAPAFTFEHDAVQRVFRLTAPDGTTEVFRDNPTRYLCLAPDTETGETRPVMKRGKPVYLYLAREEREIR